MKIYCIDHAAMCPTTEIMIHRTHVKASFWHSNSVGLPWQSGRKTRLKHCPPRRFLCHFRGTIRSHSIHYRSKTLWTYVQAISGRTSTALQDVRADTLWTYDHRTNAVRPKDFWHRKLTFCVFMPHFLSSPGSGYFAFRSTHNDFVVFSRRSWISKWKQNAQKQHTNNTNDCSSMEKWVNCHDHSRSIISGKHIKKE